MGLLDNIKSKLTLTLVNKELQNSYPAETIFTEMFKKSFSFLVLMPIDDRDYNATFDLLRALNSSKKHLTIFTLDFKVGLLPQILKPSAMEYTINDVTKLQLPSKILIAKLMQMNFNAVIDLNRTENVFSSYIASIIRSPYKIGFVKHESDKFYNIQIENTSESAEISYKNFINCLQMF